MGYIQLSLFGKTSWERFLQMTGWILEPCCNHFPIPKFQCLLLEDGLMPVWCEGERLTCAGGSWMPSIGESPGLFSEERESRRAWSLSNSTIYRETARRPARFYALRAASGAARSLRPQARFGAQPPHSGGS